MDQGQPTPAPQWGPPPQQSQYPQPPGNWTPSAPPPPSSGGSSFSDFLNFRRMITPSIIVILYILGVIAITLVAISFVVSPLARFNFAGTLLGAAVFWLLGQLYLRVILEVLIVLFRLYESVRNIDRKTKDG